MMVRRDHGNRYNPFDYLYDRYDLILSSMDGLTYEISQLLKALERLKQGNLNLEALYELLELEKRLDLIPSPEK